jgi:hypothetical protein
MLASSLREEAQATVSNKPGHRGEHEGNRKTIARGMPGVTGVTVVTMLVCFVLFRTRGCGRIERPAFPAPSEFRGQDSSGKTRAKARRDREAVSANVRSLKIESEVMRTHTASSLRKHAKAGTHNHGRLL